MANSTSILNKRLPREFKNNLSRYVALFFLVTLSIYIVVSLIAAADTVIETVSDNAEISNREDGYFTTLIPLTEEQINELKDKGVTLEANYSLDYRLDDDSIIRVFKQRKYINLESIDQGKHANANEVVLEKLFAEANGYTVSDAISIGNTQLKISGIGSSPDYDLVVQKISDTAADKKHFGTAFVTEEMYEQLKQNESALQQEEVLYSFVLNDAMTATELRDLLRELSFDRDQVVDTFFLDMLKKAEEPQDELRNAVGDLREGTQELSDGAHDMVEGVQEVSSASDKLAEGASELQSGAESLASSSSLLAQGVRVFHDALVEQATILESSVSSFSAEQMAYEQALKTYVLTFSTIYGAILSTGNDEATALQMAGAQTVSEAADVRSTLEALLVASGTSAGYSSSAEALREAASGMGSDGERESIIGGMLALSKGAQELSSGADELRDGTHSLATGTGELSDGASELASGANELAEGASALDEAVQELINELREGHITNLTSFVEAENNPRINASADDEVITKVAGIVAGIIVIILLVHVISVFVVHSIDRESEVIGALYSLGVKRQELIRHYLTLPLLISLLGGVTGLVLAFSPLGVAMQLTDATTYYSFPDPAISIQPYQIFYGILLPSILTLSIGYLVIRKRLRRPPLLLLRKEHAEEKTSSFKLGRMKFLQAFRLRQVLREKRASCAIGGGIFLSLLLVMLALNCYSFISTMAEQNEEDMKFEYLVALKYSPEIQPENTEAAYYQALHQEAYGYQNEVSVLGIESSNAYFDFVPAKGKQSLTISTSVASKFGVGVGDTFVLEDKVNDTAYTFTVEAIVPYSVGLYVFMDIGSMRELFDAEDEAYNVLLSDTMPDIEEGRIASISTKDDILEYAHVFMEMMSSMLTMILVVSALVFIMVLYLMMKVMIDRATTGISLIKIFGYTNKEIRRLYLDGTFWTVVIFSALSIPLAKFVMDQLWPYLIANVAIGPDLTMKPWLYGAVALFILGAYALVMLILMRRVKSITPAEVLKDRE